MKNQEIKENAGLVNIKRLKGLFAEHDKTYSAVAQAIGINRDTFTRRMKSRGLDFTIAEIYIMADFIPLSYEEIKEVFFDGNKKQEH